MKSIRRVSIEIERRELTISLTRTQTRIPGASEPSDRHDHADPATGADPDAALGACPVCGAAWLAVMTTRTGDAAPVGAESILGVLEQSGVHARLTAVGQLQVCSKSFERRRIETLTKILAFGHSLPNFSQRGK